MVCLQYGQTLHCPFKRSTWYVQTSGFEKMEINCNNALTQL